MELIDFSELRFDSDVHSLLLDVEELSIDELDEVDVLSIGVIVLDVDFDFESDFGFVPELVVVLLVLGFLSDLNSDLCLFLLLADGSLL